MPAGMLLQFRYATKYIHPSLVESRAQLVGKDVVLAYLDQSNERRESGKPPKVIPCRLARVNSVEMIGTTVIFVYELRNFVFPRTTRIDEESRIETISYDDYQDSLLQQAVSSRPLPLDWKSEDIPQRAKGYWVCEVETPNLEAVEITEVPGVWKKWEQLVSELGTGADFKRHKLSVFYHVLSVVNLRSKKGCKIVADKCEISKPGEYEVRIYIYAIKEEVPHTSWIRVSLLNQKIKLLSNPMITIDSGYDIKVARLYVPVSIKREVEIVSFETCNSYEEKFGIARFDLVFSISSHSYPILISSIATGAAGSSAAILALWRASPDKFSYGFAAFMIVLACSINFLGNLVSERNK